MENLEAQKGNLMRTLCTSLSPVFSKLTRILFLFNICFSAVAQGPDEIVWLDEAKTQAFLIPESAFAKLDWSDPGQTGFSGLGMNQGQQQLLRTLVMDRLKSNLPFECDPAPVGSTAPLSGNTSALSSFADLVRAENVNVAVVGRVVRRVPVWNPEIPYPNTRVFLRIEEVLREPASKRLEVGAELSFVEHFGDMTIGPVRFCIEPEKDWRADPAFSQGLLIGLSYPKLSATHIFATRFFEVEDRQLLPRRSRDLQYREPYPLESLRKDLSSAQRKEP